MKNISKLLAGLTVLQLSFFGFSQTKEISIRFIGNCGLHLSDGVTNIYTDFPYKSGAHDFMEYDGAELYSLKEKVYFIFTHKLSKHCLNIVK